MLKAISEPDRVISYAPRSIPQTSMLIKFVMLSAGGKTLNKIIAETGVKIDIEEDGTVYVAASDETAVKSHLNY